LAHTFFRKKENQNKKQASKSEQTHAQKNQIILAAASRLLILWPDFIMSEKE